ncbi:MAG: quinone-dependent dihydroorotate dehydrogenase [Rhodospirillaceae bacterium]
MPVLRLAEPEAAHRIALWALERGLVPPVKTRPAPELAVKLWGLNFPSPVGLAAGFDKDARAPRALLGLGFGFVEVGSVTPRPQPGNPLPRLFRLTRDRAVINRMGFNNEGLNAMLARLVEDRSRPNRGIIGVNLGKNKDQTEEAVDYIAGAGILGLYADYLVVNVSSPNTPGLRTLQDREPLAQLLRAVRSVRDGLPRHPGPPLLVKIAPDLSAEDLADVAAAAQEVCIDGIIATNTTISRPETLTDPDRGQAGGLSGSPLTEMSRRVIAELYKLTEGRMPLIGVGGIGSAEDAYARIRAGASLVQLYSAMVYEGPYLAARINDRLAALLKRDGFDCVADAVGADHR